MVKTALTGFIELFEAFWVDESPKVFIRKVY